MSNGIFTIESTTKELKGKEVKVLTNGILNEETGELVKFADLYKPFADQYINFSIKVTEKVEDKFEVPEDDTEDDE